MQWAGGKAEQIMTPMAITNIATAGPAAWPGQKPGRHAGIGTPAAAAGQGRLLQAMVGRGRALLRVYLHARKVRLAAAALASALAESREASSWPGDRLPVGAEMSAQVERLTRRLKLETEAHSRLEVCFGNLSGGSRRPGCLPSGAGSRSNPGSSGHRREPA